MKVDITWRVAVAGLLLQACFVAAQGGEGSGPSFFGGLGQYFTSTIAPNLKLTYTTANFNQSQLPAAAQFTDNLGKGQTSYAIDGAVTVRNVIPQGTALPLGLYSLGPAIEYHRSNLATQPQNNLQAGIIAMSRFDISTKPDDPVAIFAQYTAKYVYDAVSNKNDSLFPQLDLIPLVTKWGCGTPNYNAFDGQLGVFWNPDIGVQYQWGDSVNHSGRSGGELRFKGSLEVALYPFAGGNMLNKRLKLFASETHWIATCESGEYSSLQSNYNFIQAGIAYYLDQAQHFSVGLTYNNGENVETGLPYQKLVNIALQAHF